MLLVCPNCATSYRVVPSTLGTAGRQVRCARCLTVWHAHAPEPVLETAAPIPVTPAVHREDVVDVAATPRPTSDDNVAVEEVAPAAEWTAAVDEAPATDGESAADRPSGDHTDSPVPDSGEDSVAAVEAEERPALPESDDSLPVTEAPSVAPAADEEPPTFYAGPRIADDDGEEGFAARRLLRQHRRRRNPLNSPGLSSAILTLIVLIAVIVVWRKDIVRLVPQMASFYAAVGLPVNLRGLSFENVTTAKEEQDGVPVLIVEGRIASAASRPVDVPRIRFAVRGSGGEELYSWTALPSRSILAPGETIDFRSRLASPPAEGREVLVRFFTRRDAVTGTR
jgi:predicted Zn finger-like uncharacterized protein